MAVFTRCAALQARFQERHSPIACRLLESSIDVLRERCSIELRRSFVKRFGSPALSLAALLPPPFPTSAFVISAGATRYCFIAFVLSFGTGRACRFALLAYFASVFGRRSVARAWSAHALVLLGVFGGVLVCVGLLAWLVFRKSEPHTPSSTILLCVLALLAEFLDARI